MLRRLAARRGRALRIQRDGTLYASDGYEILRSHDWGARWTLDARVPASILRRVAGTMRPAARLLRHYIGALGLLPDGTRVAVARDGIYRAAPGEAVMEVAFPVTRGSRPLNLLVTPEVVLFGEYGVNRSREEIHLYVSVDGARRFEVAYTFPAGAIRHVHNVLFDRHLDAYWVLTGDYGDEPGIGLLDKDLTRIEWIDRGHQEARAVGAIVEEDALLFGTDSDRVQNRIKRIDKRSGAVTALRDVDGSSLFACRFGSVRAISTCVEPNVHGAPPASKLYLSADGDRWVEAAAYPKDRLPSIFQFGSVVLPGCDFDGPRGMLSGQAIVGLDDRLVVFELDSAAL